MANRNLSVAQMIIIASPLLDPAQKLARLQALPRVAPYLDEWRALTDKLKTTQSTDGKSPEEIRLQHEATETDVLHDHLIGGVLHVLDGLISLCAPPLSAQFAELLARAFPEGGQMVRDSYVTEAGNAALAAQRLTAADHALLACVVLPGGTLDQTVLGWLAAARKLGEIETRRATLAKPGPTRKEVLQLRQQWNRIAKVIRAAADTEPSLDDAARHALFGAYDQELARPGPAAKAAAVTPAVVAPAPKPSK